jgi:hypothetical protein
VDEAVATKPLYVGRVEVVAVLELVDDRCSE